MIWLIVAAGVASWLMTAALRRYALSRSLLDIPNARSSHTLPTPRGGGLAFVVAFLVAMLGLGWGGYVPGRAGQPAGRRGPGCADRLHGRPRAHRRAVAPVGAFRCGRLGAHLAWRDAAAYRFRPVAGARLAEHRHRLAVPGMAAQPLQLHGRHRWHRQYRGHLRMPGG